MDQQDFGFARAFSVKEDAGGRATNSYQRSLDGGT